MSFLPRRFLIFLVLGCFTEVSSLDIRSTNAPASRNDFLQAAIGSASLVVFPYSSTAAAPITVQETDSLAVMAKRALRPKPPKLLRGKLAQDFAVLLMRSSYNALDQLDCVAMVSRPLFQVVVHCVFNLIVGSNFIIDGVNLH
jgi:hypothetical protein